jgi:hypothetical protein
MKRHITHPPEYHASNQSSLSRISDSPLGITGKAADKGAKALYADSAERYHSIHERSC